VYTAVACYIVLSSASFYSVNLLYSDQWDYYGPLFRGEGLIAQFTYLHPPHRQGLGLVLIGWLASATHWNTRADALAVGAGLCAATLLALWLKVRSSARSAGPIC
jgi:hypothetical protein